MFIARYSNEGKPQGLEDHLLGVAATASCLVENTCYGEIAGLLHDIGKYSSAFQAYIRSRNPQGDRNDSEESEISGKPDHSSSGAQLLLSLLGDIAERSGGNEIRRLSELMARIIGHCIVGHHTGLLNGISHNEGPSLERRLSKSVEPYNESIASTLRQRMTSSAELILSEENMAHVCRWIDDEGYVSGRYAFSLQFFIRMLFSALVDADRLHSEKSGNLDQWQLRQSIEKEPLFVLLRKLENYLLGFKADSEVNLIRSQISEQSRKAAELKPGFFEMSVPTGGGKTLASLRFALTHAIRYGMHRVIYVMPYTSIIDQNADEFRKILDSGGVTCNVLEHHSNLEPIKETPDSRLQAENWEAPVIVTTTVQFFESLYTSRPSRCRRLHSVRKSVIVLDEAQSIPVRYFQAITWALEELVTHHGCTIVFCTATQPVLDTNRIDSSRLDNQRIGLKDIRPIIEHPKALCKSLKRVKVYPTRSGEPQSIAQVAAKVIQKASTGSSVLSIVNTKRNAVALYEELKKEAVLSCRLFHLSTSMCPRHRKDVIDLVKQMILYYRRIGTCAPVLVSTPLVEAGVNLDFDVVFRAMAGVDSIVQAAGRCNREGKMLPKLGEVYVYEAEENLGSLKDVIEAKRAAVGTISALASATELPDEDKDIIGIEAVQEYFERLYWSRSADMDKDGIVKRLAARKQLEHATDIPFADIGETFRLIKEDTIDVFVPYGDEGKRIIRELKKGRFLKLDECRIAQQYTVQVYRTGLREYDKIIEDTPSGRLVVDSSIHYGEVGLLHPQSSTVEEYML